MLAYGAVMAQAAFVRGDPGFFQRQQGLLYRNVRTYSSPAFSGFRPYGMYGRSPSVWPSVFHVTLHQAHTE